MGGIYHVDGGISSLDEGFSPFDGGDLPFVEGEFTVRWAQNDGSEVPLEVALILKIQGTYPENLMARHFLEDFYFSLTLYQRKRLLLCCRGGYERPESRVGLFAHTPDDYEDFKPYFDKVRACMHASSCMCGACVHAWIYAPCMDDFVPKRDVCVYM
jgi:hypothetical protein